MNKVVFSPTSQGMCRRGFAHLAFLLLVSANLGAAGHAESTNIRPSWSDSEEAATRLNASWLSATNQSVASDGLTIDDLIDKKKSIEMAQSFQDLNRDYDLKCEYGLVNNTAMQAHANQVQDFGHNLEHQLQSYQIQQGRKKGLMIVNTQPGLQPLVKPVAAVGVVVAVSSGTPVKMNISDGTDLVAKTDIRGRTGDLAMSSRIVNGGVSLNMTKAGIRDPNLPPPIDPTQAEDRYRVYLSRGLNLWDLSSQVSYGTSSSTLSAQLSKPLAQNLTAVVGSVRPMSSSVMGNGEESLRLMYGLQF